MIRFNTIAEKIENNEVLKPNYYAIKTLMETRKNGLYVVVKSVNKSGTKRKVRFYALDKYGKMTQQNYNIAGILNKKIDKDYCIEVRGCGMDMIYSILHDLNSLVASELGLSNIDFENFIVTCKHTTL